jgi:hypothetical protein
MVERSAKKVRVTLARAWGDEDRRLQLSAALTAPLLQALRCFLFEDPGSVLKGGVKVCKRPLVNEVRATVTEFVPNFGREGATPIQRGFNAGLLGRVQAIKLIRHIMRAPTSRGTPQPVGRLLRAPGSKF